MKVLVIGSTGQTGRHAVTQLLAKGCEVTAFARNPGAVTEKNDRLQVVRGDARDSLSLDRALAGQDAVLVAFGPRSVKKDNLQEVLMRNLIAGMKKSGVKRAVVLSAWGVDPQHVKTSFLFERIIKPLFLGNVFADKARGEVLLKASHLDYVLVCPGLLINSAARGGVRASLEGRGLQPKMTREDLASFLIEQLTSNEWLQKSPVIGY